MYFYKPDPIDVLVVLMLGNDTYSRLLGLSNCVLRLTNDIYDHWPELTCSSIELVYERDDCKRVIETSSNLHSILLFVPHSRDDLLLVSVIFKKCKSSSAYVGYYSSSFAGSFTGCGSSTSSVVSSSIDSSSTFVSWSVCDQWYGMRIKCFPTIYNYDSYGLWKPNYLQKFIAQQT